MLDPKNKKTIITILSFAMITPVLIYYILDRRGVFDTRSKAGVVFNYDSECLILSTTGGCAVKKRPDINGDGVIDFGTDYIRWYQGYMARINKNEYVAEADMDNNRVVNLRDFEIWTEEYKKYKKLTEHMEKFSITGKETNKKLAKYLGNNLWSYEVFTWIPGGDAYFGYNVEMDSSKYPNIHLYSDVSFRSKGRVGMQMPREAYRQIGRFKAPENAKVTSKIDGISETLASPEQHSYTHKAEMVSATHLGSYVHSSEHWFVVLVKKVQESECKKIGVNVNVGKDSKNKPIATISSVKAGSKDDNAVKCSKMPNRYICRNMQDESEKEKDNIYKDGMCIVKRAFVSEWNTTIIFNKNIL